MSATHAPPESLLQVSPIPTGPTWYQPITAVPPVTPVKDRGADAEGTDKLRAAPPPGLGSLLDVLA